jgi:hypothetical protein
MHRIRARIVAACIMFVAIFAFSLLIASNNARTDRSISTQLAGTQLITAKALTDHECNTTQWQFVITQIDVQADAPASVHVIWDNGASADVPLFSYTGQTAHYITTSNLSSLVTSATTSIYDTWSGQFNLSDGPCNQATTSSSSVSASSSSTSTTQATTSSTAATTTSTQATTTTTKATTTTSDQVSSTSNDVTTTSAPGTTTSATVLDTTIVNSTTSTTRSTGTTDPGNSTTKAPQVLAETLTNSGELARTGANTTLLVTVALALLAFGAVIVLTIRRRIAS